MQWAIDLLIVQGVLGAYDVLWHHEWKVRLPTRAESVLEQKLRGMAPRPIFTQTAGEV